MQDITFRAMGCQMLALLDDESAAAARALADVPQWFAAWEQQLSRFRADSELSLLNRQGYLRSASPALWEVVQLALAQARFTGGLVTPTLLGALEAAGYDRSFDALTSDLVPSVASEPRSSLEQQPPLQAWAEVRCDPATRGIELHAGMRLDLGGSAKGWAADQAVHRLAAFGPALVDAGGDIAVSGPQSDGSPWPIGVADPHSPDEQLDLLLLRHGGVATSGRDYRRWRHNGTWRHHLIDPRTQQPAITDLLSATVVGPSAAECEVAAKVLLLLGSRGGLDWLEAHPVFAGLMVLEDGSVIRSSRLDAYRWRETLSEEIGHD
ncbi:MAG: FAD:protein FMN transferase [Chloroflexi bacterium]|nr:FAD:protein FMN transferase [Chloroflexota bacterium]